MDHRGDQEHDGGAEPGKGAGGASPKRGPKNALPSSNDKVLSMLARLEKQVVDLQRQNDERVTGLAETAGEAAARGPASPSPARPADAMKKPDAKPAQPMKPDPKNQAATKTVAKPSPPPPSAPAAAKPAAAKSDAPWWAQHAAAAEAPPPMRRTPPPPSQAQKESDDEPEGEDPDVDAEAEAESDSDAEAEADTEDDDDDDDGSAGDLAARLAATRAQLQEAYLAIGGIGPEAGALVDVEEQDDPDESAEVDLDDDDDDSGDDEPADEIEAPRAPQAPLPRGRTAAAAPIASADDDDEEVVEDAEVARLRQHVEKLKAAVEKRDQEIESFEQRLQKAQASPQGGGSPKLVEAQRRQIERLTEQLTAVQGNEPGENDAVKDRDERISVLEAELAEMRGENSPKATGMGRVVGGLMGAIKGRKAPAGGAGEDGEGADELERRLAQLESERDLLQQTVQQAMREAEDAKQRLRERLDSGDPDDEGRASMVEGLQHEVERLNRELTETKSQEKGSKVDRTQKQITQAQTLRDKAAQVSQARDSLARTEKLLIKKWARQRAVIIQAYVLGIAVVCAAASLGAAHLFFPPRIAAVVDLRAKTQDGQRLTSEQAEAWARWHADVLTQASFHRTLAKRLAVDRQLDAYENPAVLAERLAADLTVDRTVPEMLTLTLAGTDRKEAIALLDMVGTALERESSTQAGMRQDRAVAALVGEGYYEKGRRYFASEGDMLISDRRNVAAAVIFVLMLGGSVLGIVRLNRWLLKTKLVMDEASTFFDSPQQPPLL